MFMEIPKLRIRFIDSLNFLQIPLKSPKTFGLDELKKGYFNNNNNNSLFTINHPQRTNKDNNNTLTTKIHEKL